MLFVGNWLLKSNLTLPKLLAKTPVRLEALIAKHKLHAASDDELISRACEALGLKRISFDLPETAVVNHEEDLSPSYALYSFIQRFEGSHQLWTQRPHDSYKPILRGRVYRNLIMLKIRLRRFDAQHNPFRDLLEIAQKAMVGHDDQIEDFNYVLPRHVERALLRYRQRQPRLR
jgi:hypothetical protein